MRAADVPRLARELLDKWGLAAWQFSWNRAIRRAGCCHYRDKTITLSMYYAQLNCERLPDDVLDTILHEIAHALAGPKAGHGPEWKKQCVRVGAKPERCYRDTVAMPTPKLEAVCGGCNRLFHRHKLPRNGNFRYCTPCGPDKGRLHWRTTTQLSTNVTAKIPMPDEVEPEVEVA